MATLQQAWRLWKSGREEVEHTWYEIRLSIGPSLSVAVCGGVQSLGWCWLDAQQGMSEHGSQQQDIKSGLVSVSAGATLYAFLCIFFRERRRSGRGKRCRNRPQVRDASNSCLLAHLGNAVVCWFHCAVGNHFHHLSVGSCFTANCRICSNVRPVKQTTNLSLTDS